MQSHYLGQQQHEPDTGPWSGRWKVVRLLGEGGQGTTYLVESRDNPASRAVLKVLKDDASHRARRRMQQEFVNLSVVAIASGSVPRVHAGNVERFAEAGIRLYFVMDYVDGKTLEERIAQSGTMSIDDAVDLALGICHTIGIGHNEQVLHRDLKPGNIMLRREDGKPVIIDYGLSFNDQNDDDVTATDERIRNSFLSLPETHASGGHRRDSRSDVTAVAAVLFYCLTGQRPGGLEDGKGRPPHRRLDVALIERFPGDLRPHHLDSLFTRAFRLLTDLRFQTIEELKGRLAEARFAVAVPARDPREDVDEIDRAYLKRSLEARLYDARQKLGHVFAALNRRIPRWHGRPGSA